MSKTIIIIPSRLRATRLPNKPLLKIDNLSIIQHAYKRAIESKVGKAYVATGAEEIVEEIRKIKGKFILKCVWTILIRFQKKIVFFWTGVANLQNSIPGFSSKNMAKSLGCPGSWTKNPSLYPLFTKNVLFPL